MYVHVNLTVSLEKIKITMLAIYVCVLVLYKTGILYVEKHVVTICRLK